MSETVFCDFNDYKHRTLLDALLRRLWGCGVYRIEITKYRSRRTDRQNKRYWGFVIPVFTRYLHEEQGYHFTKKEVHALFKSKFLRKTWTDKKTGEMVDLTGSSAELDVKEFTEYVEDCENFMANYGIIVPEQEEVKT